MADPIGMDPPLLNPVLALTKKPSPTSTTGGGPTKEDIIESRLDEQRRTLSSNIETLVENASSRVTHAGQIHLVATMFDESYAPTWTPRDLFNERYDCRLVAPARNGYLAEIRFASLPKMAKFIRSANIIQSKVEISRVKSIKSLDSLDILNCKSIDDTWKAACEGKKGKLFVLWLAPFRSFQARSSVISQLQTFGEQELLLSTYPSLTQQSSDEMRPIAREGRSSLMGAIRRYRNDEFARTIIAIPSKQALKSITASGVCFRIDPVKPIEMAAPSYNSEPPPPVTTITTQPVVAVVDGGLTSHRYREVEVWRAPALVPNHAANYAHGNRVTSLAVHAHAWNKHLYLPQIDCRVATIQAVPREGSGYICNSERLVSYLREVITKNPGQRVWNLSFNQIAPEDDEGLVSYLGHELAVLARQKKVLS